MKIILFAGGVGTRLWPLSRKNTPKQFEHIIGDKSMLQIAVDKLFPDFSWEDIYISTGQQYAPLVKKQLKNVPDANILVEPEMRDVGPAVGLTMAQFVKHFPDEPVALLWGSDHLVRKEEVFRSTLAAAEKIVREDGDRIVFIGQKPRFASQNLGYIAYGGQDKEVDGYPIYKFKGFEYRPHLSTAEKFLRDGKHAWNLGYFVTTPRFLWRLFSEFAPDLFTKLEEIKRVVDTPSYQEVLDRVYPAVEKISFDNAILEKMDPKYGSVISVDIGWSDIGAWEALKEALSPNAEENVIKGNVLVEDSTDTLVFNYNHALVVCIDLKDMVVVNTKDVLLVCPKNSVPKIKEVVKNLEGTSHEHLV